MPTLNIEGRRVKVDDSFLSLSPVDQQKQVEEIASQIGVKPKASPQTNADTSFTSAFKYGVDQPLENIGVSMEAAGKSLGSDTLQSAGKSVRDFTDAPQNYDPATPRFLNPQEGDTKLFGYGIGSLPRAVAEQAGGIVGDLGSRAVGGAAGGAIGTLSGPQGAIAGAATGALAGPALFQFAQSVGPIALERAKNNGRAEPDWSDWTVAAGGAGALGALNAVGIKGLGTLNSTIAKSTLKQGVTGIGQDLVQQTAETAGTDKGLEIDPKRAIGQGVIGAATGLATEGTIKGTRAVKDGVSDVVNAKPPVLDPDAAVSVAKRLVRESQSNDIDLGDVSRQSEKGAQLALDNVHSEISESIKKMWSEIKGVAGDKANSIEDVVQKSLVDSARRDAANKVKNMVADHEIDAISNLEIPDRNGNPIKLGDLDIGKQFIFNLKESNELTRLARQGPKGGVSRITDRFNPLGNDSTYQGADGAVNALSLLGAIHTGGMSTAAQIGVVGTGRAIDAITGRRSRVKRFAESYADQEYNAPDSVASHSYFEEKRLAQKALDDAKSAADQKRAQDRLDALAAREAKRQEAQAQRDAEAKKRQEERDSAKQLDVFKKTMAFRQRMSKQQAKEQNVAPVTETVQTQADVDPNTFSPDATMMSNMREVLRVAKMKESLQIQRQKAAEAEAKAKTLEEKRLAAEAKQTVTKREAKLDAVVKARKVTEKAQAQQSKSQAKQETPWSQADIEKLGIEGGRRRDPVREQRGAENIMRMQDEALSAADNYPDKKVGLKVREAVEKLRDNLRGTGNNEDRIKLYSELLQDVGEEHADFVRRYVRGLAFVFNRK